MPTDGKTQTHGFLDQLSTEQLLDLIRTDFDSGEEGDERREKEQPTGLLSGAGQAWEDFQTYYNIPDSEDCPPYPMRRPDLPAAEKKPVKRRGHGILLKRLISVAAALAVSLFSMVAAQAFGLDVFGALAAWYPKGTEFAKDIETIEAAGSSTITCGFTCGGKTCYMEVQQYYGEIRISNQTFEKDASDIKEYYSNGRLFYIMSNLSRNRATYSNDRTLITIEGNFSLETLKQIIDSIGA